jgi:peptidoglycan/xylan/chitin deacetylase (PgdA/CDA1 family)
LRALTPAQRAAVCASVAISASEVEDILEWMKTLDPVRRGGVEDAIRSATPGFEPTSLQRERFDVMRWNELAALDPDLITIGSHTVTHPILTTLDHSALVFEIQESRRWLERRLGRAVEHFCYPGGAYNPVVLGCVRECYRSAVATTEAGLVAGDDGHCLHRIPASDELPLLAWRLHRPEA